MSPTESMVIAERQEGGPFLSLAMFAVYMYVACMYVCINCVRKKNKADRRPMHVLCSMSVHTSLRLSLSVSAVCVGGSTENRGPRGLIC